MELDYELIWGLEEWKDNGYKITKDFYRLKREKTFRSGLSGN